MIIWPLLLARARKTPASKRAGTHAAAVWLPLSGLDEFFFRGIPRDHLYCDLGHRLAYFGRDLVHDFMDRPLRDRQVMASLGVGVHTRVNLGHRANRIPAGGHDCQRNILLCGLPHRPAKGTARMLRAVHPDEDSERLCSSGSRFVPILLPITIWAEVRAKKGMNALGRPAARPGRRVRPECLRVPS